MNDETYNGWTNWDTWNANLHLNNDYDGYLLLLKCKTANEIETLFKCIPILDEIDLNNVNWEEIFKGISNEQHSN